MRNTHSPVEDLERLFAADVAGNLVNNIALITHVEIAAQGAQATIKKGNEIG